MSIYAICRTRRGLVSLCLAVGLTAAALTSVPAAAPMQAPALADAHVHLSLGSVDALERYLAAGVSVVRDCGGDIDQLIAWRAEIAAGRRRGPRIFLAGPILDGPKPGAPFRLTVTTPEEAIRAVDSLAGRVDFIKTHNAIPPDAFLAILRRARERGVKVAAHLPAGVPAWTAAEAGAASIEHAAESLLASPISAGLVRDALGALEWWASAAGDAAIKRLGATGVTVVPTLVRYEASIAAAATPELRSGRAAALPKLIELVGRLHRAGVPLLAGSDLAGLDGALPAEKGPAREVELLQAAGLSRQAALDAASPAALERWFQRPFPAPVVPR